MSRKRKRGDNKKKELPNNKRRKIESSQNSSSGTQENSQSSQPPTSSQQNGKKRRGRKPNPKKPQQKKTKRIAIDPEILGKLVNTLIRYLLSVSAGSKVVKREDIRKYVFSKYAATKGHTGLIERIIKLSNEKLRLTFGYELVEMTTKMQKDQSVENNLLSTQQLEIGSQVPRDGNPNVPHKVAALGTKVWILRLTKRPSPSFSLSDQQVQERCSQLMSETRAKKLALLTIITGFVYGKRDDLPENVLWEQLKRLGIVKGESHPDFGGKPEKVIQEFLRSYYLIRVKDETESKHEGKPVYKYSSGPRMHKDVNQAKLMEFFHMSVNAELSENEKKNMKAYEERVNAESMMMTQQAFAGMYVPEDPAVVVGDDDAAIIIPPPPSQPSGSIARKRIGVVIDDDDEDEDDDFEPGAQRQSRIRNRERATNNDNRSQEPTSQAFIEIED